MLKDIEMETVEWMPNFDGSLNEPIVLPSKFPNLLVNVHLVSRLVWRPTCRLITFQVVTA